MHSASTINHSLFPQHGSTPIYHNMAPVPLCLSAILEIFSPLFSIAASLSVLELQCCTSKNTRKGKKWNNFLLISTTVRTFSFFFTPSLCTLLSFYILSFFLLSSSTQPLYSPHCHAAIISQRKNNTASRKQQELSIGLSSTGRERRRRGGGRDGESQKEGEKKQERGRRVVCVSRFQMATSGLLDNESVG